MFVMSPMEKKIDNSDDHSDDEIGPFHTNKHGFPINDTTWNRMWKIASRIYPDAKKDMEEIKNSDNLTDVPVLASPVLSPLMTVGQSLRVVQDFICNLSYNHTGTQLFEIRKTRPLAGLMDTAKEIIKESLPIKCLEAVILAIYLTNSLSSVERFPIGFKSVFNGHRYYHVVLGIYYNGTFGALGLSRREDLMNKALKWKSLHDMICDYQSAYANYSHELKKVRLGGIVSHDMHSHERIHWGISIVNMTKTTDVEQRNIMDQFTKCIRSQYAYSPTPPSKKDASRTSKKFYESLTATKKEHKKENYISKSVSKSPKPKKISSAFDSSYHVHFVNSSLLRYLHRMDLEAVEGMIHNDEWATNYVDDAEEEEYEHQYDDYEDLFSNETMSDNENNNDDKEIGAYLETEPTLQKEVGQLIMLQRYLDSLKEKLSEKEFDVSKCREELMASRIRSKALEEELFETDKEMQIIKEKENITSFNLLLGRRKKLQREIDNEILVTAEVKNNLEIAELVLVQVEAEQKHYAELAAQTTEKEEIIKKHKMKLAKHRLSKHDRTTKLMLEKHKIAERNLLEKIKARKSEQERITSDAIINHEKAKRFLKGSMSRLREKEEELKVVDEQHVDRRVKSIIGLKESIALNRENLKALQARDAARARKKQLAEAKIYEKVVSEGGNPEFFMIKHKKIKQKEEEKKNFLAKQKENKKKIIETILSEENNLKMRKKQQPWLFGETDDKHVLPPLPKSPIHEKLALTDDDYEPIFLKQEQFPSIYPLEDQIRDTFSDDSDMIEEVSRATPSDRISVPTLPQADQEEEVLTQPEFEGLWDQKQKMQTTQKKAGSGDAKLRPSGGTKMEQEILEKVLSKHKQHIVKKQIAGGREFKGQPFYSKPDVIHFKDLEVGKVYKKKIIITNVSYSINFLRLTGLSEHLKDFIKIDFNPPGQMSAGMCCEMFVTFKPMINEDLSGEVTFLAQTGPFSIPLKCSTKKCDLSVDVDAINFGTQVIGETIRRSVTLVNNGALGTRFEFSKVPDKPLTSFSLETSLGRITTAETSGLAANDISEPLRTATTAQRETTKKSKRIESSVPNTVDTTKQTRVALRPDKSIQSMEGEEFESVEVIEEFQQLEDEDVVDFTGSASDFHEPIPDELKVGEIMSGEIEPFSSIRLDIVFSPCIPGDIQANFQVTFADQLSKPIDIKVSAVAIDVPVWLERQNIDMKICMYDRLYQEQIQVHNRASTALRLHFEVPKELQGHIELLPKTGFIQAKSKFVAQLKFLPRQSLAEDACGLFDPENGILEVPLVVRVADQTKPVPFVVNAVVTTSDLEFDQTAIDFGCCSVYESVVYTVKLTNHSILPQLYGFVGVPDFIDIQPNDGFGKILPLETIDLDIIMSAAQAKSYEFTLNCKSGINRDFNIHCKAVGVLPPLELSHQVINFAATALDDVSTSVVYVVNSHTSANEYTHPVPRIGKGEIAPVAPTSFEFIIPENAPISMHPMVGTIEPGKKCHVTVEFAPKLDEALVREKACKVAVELREKKIKEEQLRLKREEEEEEAKQLEEEKKKRKKTPKTPGKGKAGNDAAQKSNKNSAKTVSATPIELGDLPTPESVDINSQEYIAAYSYLTRLYTGSFQSFRIPCFVASGSCSENSSASLPYHEANCLYLEVHCPVIKPPVVIISNYGDRVLDYGPISIGQNTIKSVSIQNISDDPIELSASITDTGGPFLMLNALRHLLPDEAHTIVISFTPTVGKIFQEVLKIRGPNSSLDVHLRGQGVTPDLRLDLVDNKLDFGHVLQGEPSTSAFKIENHSLLTVKYSIHMDSNSLLRHDLQQELPEFIVRNNESKKTLIGTQNHNGLCVFDCVPCGGELKTGEQQEIQVTFYPDHESRHYSDGARFVLFNSELSHLVHMTGISHAQTMYVEGNDPLDVSIESIALDANDLKNDTEAEASQSTKKIFLSFKSRVTPNGFEPTSRHLTIGCVKTNNAAKKVSEWIVDQSNVATNCGFTIDPLKCSVDSETPKQLTVTWTPPKDHDPSNPVNASVIMTLKSDVTTIYNILLTGLITFQ